jgi:hypothetical protein
MFRAAPGSELVFQLGDFRAEYIAPALYDGQNGGVDFILDAFALGLKVDEGEGHEERLRA